MLKELIDNTKTDKNTSHSYLDTYERLFSNKKYDTNNILEIGIGEHKNNKENGGSIKLWNDYFPNSTIYGLDIIDINNINEKIVDKERIKLYTSINAYDQKFIQKEFIQKNITFDILIDDGPHTLESMILFIEYYLPLLNRNGGVMVIEDIPSDDFVNTLLQKIPNEFKSYVEIVDLRSVKNRWDDILLVIKFPSYDGYQKNQLTQVFKQYQLLIFYLTDTKRHYTFPHYIQLLNGSKYKEKWTLLILTNDNDNDFYKNYMDNTDINYEIVNVEYNNNYMKKVFKSVDYAKERKIPYVMKCDNDLFIPSKTLDFMIENTELLDNPRHLTISPTLSSGIPSVEYFIRDFLTEEERKNIETLFLKTEFYDRDGGSYCNLNKYTLNANEWNKDEFFNEITKMEHHYKGIHPIRFNFEAIQYLNDCIIKNKENLFKEKQMEIITDGISPYFCDSVFLIKTETYEKIITDNSLFVDGFDEVPLNKYAWKNNMNHLFIKNGFSIHMYYNWCSDHFNYEKDFTDKFFNVRVE